MLQTTPEVKKIIEYLEGKIELLQEKLKQYDSPMMQEMAKNSPHLQMDYIRLSTELQANQDNLLAIQKFSGELIIGVPIKKKKPKPKKKAEDKDEPK